MLQSDDNNLLWYVTLPSVLCKPDVVAHALFSAVRFSVMLHPWVNFIRLYKKIQHVQGTLVGDHPKTAVAILHFNDVDD